MATADVATGRVNLAISVQVVILLLIEVYY